MRADPTISFRRLDVPVKMTRDEWRATPVSQTLSYPSEKSWEWQLYIIRLNPETGGTELVPVEIVE